jgi:hypothetical protein
MPPGLGHCFWRDERNGSRWPARAADILTVLHESYGQSMNRVMMPVRPSTRIHSATRGRVAQLIREPYPPSTPPRVGRDRWAAPRLPGTRHRHPLALAGIDGPCLGFQVHTQVPDLVVAEDPSVDSATLPCRPARTPVPPPQCRPARTQVLSPPCRPARTQMPPPPCRPARTPVLPPPRRPARTQMSRECALLYHCTAAYVKGWWEGS